MCINDNCVVTGLVELSSTSASFSGYPGDSWGVFDTALALLIIVTGMFLPFIVYVCRVFDAALSGRAVGCFLFVRGLAVLVIFYRKPKTKTN